MAFAACKALLQGQLGKYLAIGVSVYLFELAVIVIAESAGATTFIAIGLSFWLGLAVSFFLQKMVAFNDRRMHHRVLLPQIIAVGLLVLFNFGFTLGVAHLLADLVPTTISRTIALGITTVWNFYLYKTRIFKTEDPIID